MGKSRIQLLREKWGRYLAGDIPWGRFTPQALEVALQAEKHWRERFWSKHGQGSRRLVWIDSWRRRSRLSPFARGWSRKASAISAD
jgi:hypothetical protein